MSELLLFPDARERVRPALWKGDRKLCTGCGKYKKLASFKPKKNKDAWPRPQCRICRREKQRIRRSKTPSWIENVKRLHGLSPEQYNAMREAFDYRCGICRIHEDDLPTHRGAKGRLCVDHCHNTDRIRGLLCMWCNTTIGMMKDDPALFMACIAYLERTKPQDLSESI
jgi:hypothetical protein